jgi:hypothetical protein
MTRERKRVNLDPAVAAVIGDGQRREKARHMTRTQRRQAERDAQRQRVTLELDPRIVAMIKAIAEREGCSPAGAVNLLVSAGIEEYVEGQVEFCGNRRPSDGPRYEWVIEVAGLAALRAKLEDREG